VSLGIARLGQSADRVTEIDLCGLYVKEANVYTDKSIVEARARTTNSLTSLKRVLNSANWKGTQTQVSPLSFLPFAFALRWLIRRVNVLTASLFGLFFFQVPHESASTPAKRGHSRPKGSENKKSAVGTAASTAAGEKGKWDRPLKVRPTLMTVTPPDLITANVRPNWSLSWSTSCCDKGGCVKGKKVVKMQLRGLCCKLKLVYVKFCKLSCKLYFNMIILNRIRSHSKFRRYATSKYRTRANHINYLVWFCRLRSDSKTAKEVYLLCSYWITTIYSIQFLLHLTHSAGFSLGTRDNVSKTLEALVRNQN